MADSLTIVSGPLAHCANFGFGMDQPICHFFVVDFDTAVSFHFVRVLLSEGSFEGVISRVVAIGVDFTSRRFDDGD